MEFNIVGYEAYLASLHSSTRLTAERIIQRYEEDCEENEWNHYLVSTVSLWADHLHTEDMLTTSTIWSYLSHVNAYFEFGLKKIVKNDDPTIKRKMKLWEKQDSIKKAAVSSQQIILLHK
jgi:hypothetical protein